MIFIIEQLPFLEIVTNLVVRSSFTFFFFFLNFNAFSMYIQYIIQKESFRYCKFFSPFYYFHFASCVEIIIFRKKDQETKACCRMCLYIILHFPVYIYNSFYTYIFSSISGFGLSLHMIEFMRTLFIKVHFICYT